jgi:hypothetical protein
MGIMELKSSLICKHLNVEGNSLEKVCVYRQLCLKGSDGKQSRFLKWLDWE